MKWCLEKTMSSIASHVPNEYIFLQNTIFFFFLCLVELIYFNFSNSNTDDEKKIKFFYLICHTIIIMINYYNILPSYFRIIIIKKRSYCVRFRFKYIKFPFIFLNEMSFVLFFNFNEEKSYNDNE